MESGTAEQLPISGALCNVLQNDGEGDCLFFALEGRNLEAEELLGLRVKVAAKRHNMKVTEELNSNEMAATFTQIPGIGFAMMQGRHQ